MKKLPRRLALLAFAAVLPADAAAQSAEDFYRGKTLDFYIGQPSGVGADIWGRALIQFMGKHIPGNPHIVARNVPGAGGLTMVRQMDRQVAADGLSFGIINAGLFTEAALKPHEVMVDMTKLTWIGNMSNNVKMCFTWGESGFANLDDLKKKTSQWGGLGSQGGTFLATNILKYAIGETIHPVQGYAAANEIFLAMERRELDGFCTGYDTIPGQRPTWIPEKKINIVVQFGRNPDPDMPGVPSIYDQVASDDVKDAIDFLTLSDQMTRPIFAPPGVPQDRAQVLRDAFVATMKDPEFAAHAKKLNLPLAVKSADQVAEYVTKIVKASSRSVELARKLNEQ